MIEISETHPSLQKQTYLWAMATWIVIALNPFYIWGYTPQFQALIAGVCLVLFSLKKNIALREYFFGLLFSLMVFLFYYFYGASILGCLYFMAGYLIFYCIPQNEVLSIFRKSKRLIAILLLPGICIWFLHHLSGDNKLFLLGPLPEYKIPDQLKAQNGVGYFVYPTTVVLDYMLDNPFYRFFGFFDEPGALGTFAALLLAADRFNLKSRSNLIIFISGILSLSMAFFILSLAYFAIKAVRGNKRNIVLLSVMVALVMLSAQNDYLKTVMYDRFAYKSEGLAGDNRNTDGFNKLFAEWQSSDTRSLIFGSEKEDDSGSASFKKIIFHSGILGTAFFVLTLLGFALRHRVLSNMNGMAFSLLLILSIVQRPLVIAPAFLLLIAAAGCREMSLNKSPL
ncbi:hypothetical protein FBY10_1011046 [Pseudomonas sp. SJZ103]|uniref:hypothetical protein n=1 Tax=unclassified Pseudomonas TaxID=196821 RepID=UPI0011A0C412|nr:MULTISPECIES: hypothetical protein [unclassified Pseudomonas]MBB6287765.1 hypothetical protein [Pseudomonas sp. SJZ073]MBB6312737.1 hypothetical protein [Pseudomonas sp. JAI120]MCS4310748.1 hypothetical protein [Pseudomonas sp. BIGb0381]TWC75328.1 hypothetical protein FBY10_1011046 [Pseudomonas sp. SJZ103]TWC92544.1 hypothetical protein FBY08_10113 [Pseudomonas sp. SJZ094]